MKNKTIHIAGAGLAGTLMAILLVQKGYSVKVFEKRSDPRITGIEGGRSINLALAARGLYALQQAGIAENVLKQVVMMRGRMVHDSNNEQHFLRYGKDDSEVIWSVHRGRLNIALIEAAEQQGVHIQFNAAIQSIDRENKTLSIANEQQLRTERYKYLIGADGAGSAVRHNLIQQTGFTERWEPLGHHYKELEIAPNANNQFQLDENCLHIWPRGNFMCIALPNTEKTFTVTLFLPATGAISFEQIQTAENASQFFMQYFSDVYPLLTDFANDWEKHPESQLSTLHLETWHDNECIVLLGDAAHAMVPFHGQGMNCAFEDCLALREAIDQHDDWRTAIREYESMRMDNARSIQQMALENYLEMRDKVDDDKFLLQRSLERKLAELHPNHFVPRYSMVTFTRIPYAIAYTRGNIQRQILQTLCAEISDIHEVDYALASRLIHQQLEPFHVG